MKIKVKTSEECARFMPSIIFMRPKGRFHEVPKPLSNWAELRSKNIVAREEVLNS